NIKKNLILCLGFSLLVSVVEAQTSFKVLLRQERSHRIYYTHVELPNLESTDSFDGKYFKIVKGKNKEAIPFDEEDHDILLRAATVYYHLNMARDFWVRHIKSEF